MKPRVMTLALCAALGGCASTGVSMHTMPMQTPAADNAAAVKRAAELAATAQEAAQAKSAAVSKGSDAAAAAPLSQADAPPPQTYDPWERLNRFSYRFNARFDAAVFLPVADTYRRLPSPVRTGVHNFFGNLAQVGSVVNYTLQGRLRNGVKSLGRFVINTTLGVGGLFDVATSCKLPNRPTGFGTTLAQWGMHPGAYLVIPFFGPSTLREGVGLLGDYGVSYGIDIGKLYRGDVSWGLGVANAVDQRANIDFRYYASGSPFEYDNIRFLYVRKLLLEDEGLHKASPPRKKADVPAGQ